MNMKFLVKLGKSGNETRKMLLQVYVVCRGEVGRKL
jgi:hypothetical protein